MKISSSYFFDRATSLITQGQASVAQTQTRLATGENLIRPSDEPDAALAIERLQQSVQSQESLSAKLKVVLERYRAQETALGSISNVAIRIKEIAVQAANDTLGPQNRQALATEMQALRDQLLSLANTLDSNGNYVFAGSNVSRPAFEVDASGYPGYKGDQTRMQVSIGDQRSIPMNRTGTDAFVSVARTDAQGNTRGVGFFQSIDELIAGSKNSDQMAMQRGLGELDRLLQGVVLAQSAVGSGQATLEHQGGVIDATILNLKTTLSSLQDLDYATAVTTMNQQMLSLEAAQSSFAKISQLNLFNFIK